MVLRCLGEAMTPIPTGCLPLRTATHGPSRLTIGSSRIPTATPWDEPSPTLDAAAMRKFLLAYSAMLVVSAVLAIGAYATRGMVQILLAILAGLIFAVALWSTDGSIDEIRDHQVPWGVHRQGGFIDPFGHLWLVGDRSPLTAHPKF
jgi:hypothetical protein